MKNGVDTGAGNGMTNTAYNVPNLLVDWHLLDVAIPVGHWRAPYANANTFATESFMDELAHTAGKDPVAFRLAMMEPGSRPRNVLDMQSNPAFFDIRSRIWTALREEVLTLRQREISSDIVPA